ncbi:MAG: TlpA family protein disulfide reductase [Sandaracinaceae bacterium]
MRRADGGFALVCLVVLVGCTPAEPAAVLPEPATQETRPSGPQLTFVQAEPGDVAAQVMGFMAEARADARVPLVYVGATWCEPCQYFHRAAVAGELDDELPRMALLEFDRDHDGDRLEAAGYGSRMIPLFVVPDDAGRGTERRIEGSIHGPTSPQQIAPRLRAIVE